MKIGWLVLGVALVLSPIAARADGAKRAPLNGVVQWWRVAGGRHRTTPLIVVHGGPGGNHWNFERSAGLALEKSRTVVYWEQRGSGRSQAPADANDYSVPILVDDLEALRKKLGARSIDLLGYSFGALLAAEYTLAHPQRVRRLVLQAPADTASEWLAWNQIYGFLAVADEPRRKDIGAILADSGAIRDKLERVWNTVDRATVDRFLFEDQTKAAWNRAGWEASKLKNTGQMAKALDRRPASPLLSRIPAIRAPTLVLIGLHDRNTGVDFARDLTRLLPRGRLRVFEHSAHFPDIEETERWSGEVLTFLASPSTSL